MTTADPCDGAAGMKSRQPEDAGLIEPRTREWTFCCETYEVHRGERCNGVSWGSHTVVALLAEVTLTNAPGD